MPASELPVLYIKPKADFRLRRGHPWIYSNEVDVERSPLKGMEAGGQVLVQGAGGMTFGVALVSPNNLICARLLSRNDEDRFSPEWLQARILSALSWRERCYEKSCYRLIYGDSDGLPGLVVDRYGDYLSVQISTVGMENRKSVIIDALQAVLAPRAIVLRNDHSSRQLEGMEEYNEVIGELPDRIALVENGTYFQIPLLEGQKTGWFYDHRDNRRRVQGLSQGARVLDVFSYFGGWGLQAASAGARDVTLIDASGLALDVAAENASAQGVADRVTFKVGKAVDCLKELAAEGRQFDIVILDPPAFIKRRKDQKKGEAAYRHINDLGIRLVAPGGVLVSASCSMHLPNERLGDIVAACGHKSQRSMQWIARGGQGADHPIHPAIPETDYLKALFSRID